MGNNIHFLFFSPVFSTLLNTNCCAEFVMILHFITQMISFYFGLNMKTFCEVSNVENCITVIHILIVHFQCTENLRCIGRKHPRTFLKSIQDCAINCIYWWDWRNCFKKRKSAEGDGETDCDSIDDLHGWIS